MQCNIWRKFITNYDWIFKCSMERNYKNMASCLPMYPSSISTSNHLWIARLVFRIQTWNSNDLRVCFDWSAVCQHRFHLVWPRFDPSSFGDLFDDVQLCLFEYFDSFGEILENHTINNTINNIWAARSRPNPSRYRVERCWLWGLIFTKFRFQKSDQVYWDSSRRSRVWLDGLRKWRFLRARTGCNFQWSYIVFLNRLRRKFSDKNLTHVRTHVKFWVKAEINDQRYKKQANNNRRH